MASAGWQGGGGVVERVGGFGEGGRGNQDGPPAMGIRSSVATTGCPFRRARNGTVARAGRVIPQHGVADRSRMVFSKKICLGHTPRLAANSTISLRRAKAAGPARPRVSWLCGTKQHAPVPVRLYLSRLSGPSLTFPVAPVTRAAALTAAAANGCVTHMSATIRRPGSSASRSPARSRAGSVGRAAKQQHGLVQHVAEWARWEQEGRRALCRWTAQWWLWQWQLLVTMKNL